MERPKQRSGWLGRVVLTFYALGYFAHIGLAGLASWSSMGWYQWWTYMAFQIGYATVWPLWALLHLTGIL